MFLMMCGFSLVFFSLIYIFAGPLRPLTSEFLRWIFGDYYYTVIGLITTFIIPVFVLVIGSFLLYTMYKTVGYTQNVVTAVEGVLAGRPVIVPTCYDARPGDTDRYDALFTGPRQPPVPSQKRTELVP